MKTLYFVVTEEEKKQLKKEARENFTTLKSLLRHKVFGEKLKPKKSKDFSHHKEILRMVKDGHPLREIADKYDVSHQAISSIIIHYRDKLGFDFLSPKDFVEVHFNKIMAIWDE